MSREHDTSSESPKARTCPHCGSEDVEDSTTVDLAFGEEIPVKVCKNCDRIIFQDETG